MSLSAARGRSQRRGVTCSARGSFSMPPRGWPIRRSRPGWTATPTVSVAGDEGSARNASRGCTPSRARDARAVFPPQQVAEVVAVACELPTNHGRPLGRFSRTELHRLVLEQGVTEASASTIWRWLHDRSLKPWQQRSWIFPRDPDFQAKAGRVLDLYERRFEGRRLHPGEFVICADEKSQLQALGRRHDTVPAGPGRPTLVEFEYKRGGTLAYLAAWDVHHANLFTALSPRPGSTRSAWSRFASTRSHIAAGSATSPASSTTRRARSSGARLGRNA